MPVRPSPPSPRTSRPCSTAWRWRGAGPICAASPVTTIPGTSAPPGRGEGRPEGEGQGNAGRAGVAGGAAGVPRSNLRGDQADGKKIGWAFDLLLRFPRCQGSRTAAWLPGGRPASSCSERVDEGVHFLFGFLLLVAVALLEFAHKLVLFAADKRPIVIRQLGPFRAHLTGKLLPFSCELVPIHRRLLTR